MARSISFVMEGDVDTLVTITELDDGTLRFDLAALGSGLIGDLRGFFFDIGPDDDGNDPSFGSLSVSSATGYEGDITDSLIDENSVDTLGKDANLKGSVTNELGDFDVGVEFGTSGMSADDIQETSFILSSTESSLSLDMFDLVDFGIRYTSVGEENGQRSGSAKIGDQSNGVADNDVLGVDENSQDSVDLLANDTNGATNVLTAAFDADGNFIATAAGFEREVVVDDRVLGTLTVTAAGIATFAADGANIDELGHDAIADYRFSYTSTAPDGSLATADADLSVFGVNDTPIAEDVSGSLGEDDTSILVDFVASDIDFGDTLSFQILDAPTDAFGNQYGSATNNNDGTFTFAPGDQFQFLEEGESRDVVFTYVAIDDSGTATDTSAARTATITVNGAFDAPVEQQGELLFTSTDQSMFGTGGAFVLDPDLPFIGIDTGPQTFDIDIVNGRTFSGGALEGILDGIEGIVNAIGDLGCTIGSIFGADCDSDVDLPSSISTPDIDLAGSTEFKIGLQPYFELTSGDVDSEIPVDVVFTTPRQVEVGDTFIIESAYTIDNGATFMTNSPDVNFGLDFVFDIDVNAGLQIGASTFGGARTRSIFDIDTANFIGEGGLVDGDPALNIFDFSAEDDLEKSIDLGGFGSLDLNFPVIETTGGLIDADTLESSGEDDVAALTIDVDRLATTAAGLPPLGDSFSTGLTIDILGESVNLISANLTYDIAAVNLNATLSAIQDFSLDIDDLPLVAMFEDGSSINGLSLGDDITVTAPTDFDADIDGDADGLIDFSVDVDMDAVFSNLTTLGFDLNLFVGLLRLTGGITSDFFNGPSFSLFPGGAPGTADDFFLSDTIELFETDTFATLFDETFDLNGFEENPNTIDTFDGFFDVA